ncbi:hypothetical protein [Naasia lichenicola]|uniref:Uncharacterized protein n=1 Tax=Naasia lichenicola TaxID=2565933 RepID=A0A4S4FND6_9MICO|nr:hypothetical protein [Naasia lichenicola]THG30776.1 hypothetical protein E6C64_09055 [Naasia lichenicola]THG32013.1 hypothetical protein E6C64_08200 [Naasia lichenicola]
MAVQAFLKQLAFGLLDLGKTPKEAAAILGRISIALAVLPAITNEYDFAFERQADANTRRVTVEVGAPAAVKGVGSTKVVDLLPWSDRSTVDGASELAGDFSGISGRADAYRCFGERSIRRVLHRP